jgi:hypothetical protein
MATQKLQPTRALQVIASDNANIPYISLIDSGTNTTVNLFRLISSSSTFITDNVKQGDVVYNITDGTAATVVSVISQTEIFLNGNIFLSLGKSFEIYQQSPQTGLSNQGAVLYIGTGGTLKVLTSGNDIVTFVNIQDGTFFPINVIKVYKTGTTALNIIALW